MVGGDFIGGEMVWWRGDQIPRLKVKRGMLFKKQQIKEFLSPVVVVRPREP